MAARRVFVAWKNPLILAALRALLKQAEIEWVGEAIISDNLTGMLSNLKPDILLFEGQEAADTAKVIRILETCNWNLRVIGLNMQGNEVSLYEVAQSTIDKKEDLLNQILKE